MTSAYGGFRLRAVDGAPLEGSLLFRSASLAHITEDEAAYLVGDLGVRSIYDLRNQWEVASSPEPRIMGVKTLAFEPSTDRGRSDASRRLVAGVIGEYGAPEERMIRNYRRYAREFPLMGTVLRTMAAERRAALVHCEHGKDRTGVLCAVLQRIAGFSEDDVMAGYLATNEVNAAATAREMSQLERGMTDEERAVLRSFLEARPTYLRAFFDEIDGHAGGFSAYVRDALRLTPVQVANLRELLNR
ncbi:tyrosine-protein phosphatase [Eggerthella sinensis]|uniref:tyrosine-protein phosphatase n=1 Tax=Eggerthella sinensis TaxID=242230 RepID=UPI0022E7C36A|nr:tyrosine-protein phosphatase [Eggerthella sinensis]